MYTTGEMKRKLTEVGLAPRAVSTDLRGQFVCVEACSLAERALVK